MAATRSIIGTRPLWPTHLCTSHQQLQHASEIGRYCLQAGVSTGVQEAPIWQQNAAAWSETLLRQFPLYRDLLQPVALAVHEVRYGLSLMLHPAGLQTHAATGSAAALRLGPALVADTLTFPSRISQGELSMPLPSASDKCTGNVVC